MCAQFKPPLHNMSHSREFSRIKVGTLEDLVEGISLLMISKTSNLNRKIKRIFKNRKNTVVSYKLHANWQKYNQRFKKYFSLNDELLASEHVMFSGKSVKFTEYFGSIAILK